MPHRPTRPPRPSKYQRLAAYLAAQKGDTPTLSLAQIEVIIGFALPDSAYVEHSYWAYAPTALVRILREAGWQARLQVREHIVVFTRTTTQKA